MVQLSKPRISLVLGLSLGMHNVLLLPLFLKSYSRLTKWRRWKLWLVATQALLFATKVSVTQAILEGDSWLAIKALQEESLPLASHNLLFEDAKFYSRSFVKLLYSRTSRTSRETNNLAHSLARHAINVSYYAVWMEFIPPQFNAEFQADLVVIS